VTFWRKLLFWLAPFFVGRCLNLWQVGKYGCMPLTYPWGDWIPVAGRWLFSIGDVLQLIGFVAVILVSLTRACDERYVRRT
jgi:hypothetical protein